MNIPLTPLRFLRYAAQQYPRRTAIVCNDERFTYAQMAERVSRLAGALREAGIRPGDRVAFLSSNCHRLLEAYYGVLEAGAVLLPLNIRLTPANSATSSTIPVPPRSSSKNNSSPSPKPSAKIFPA